MTFTLPAAQRLHWKWRLLIFMAAASALAALQWMPLRADGSIAGVGDICPLRNFTGLPCPLCGLTRSLLTFFQGNWHASLLWHPLGPLLGMGAVIGFLMLMTRPHPLPLAAKLPHQSIGIALLILFAGAWTLRLAGIFPLPLSP